MVSPILIYFVWPTSDEKRIALVLGNSDYAHSYHIGSAVNNAKEMSRSLRRLGFDVIEGTDLTRSAIQSSIQMFAAQLKDADIALLYYSGYVYQESERTYITPIEANPFKPYHLAFQAIELRSLLIHMANSTSSNLVLFDACRAILSSATKSVLNGKCLPMKRIPIQRRMIISYPTKSPVALTTMQQGNSDFTKSFLEIVDRQIADKKHVSLYNILSAVQKVISFNTRSEQQPWNEVSLEGDFSFNLEFTKDIRDTQLTVVDSHLMRRNDNVQSQTDPKLQIKVRCNLKRPSCRRWLSLAKSQTDLNLSDIPDLIPEEKISGTNLSAIAPDYQIKKHYKKIRPINKRKTRNRVTRQSWQQQQLRRMLEVD